MNPPTYDSNLPCFADAALAYLSKSKRRDASVTQVLYRNILVLKHVADDEDEAADLPPLTVTRL